LPYSLVKFSVEEANIQASSSYVPQVYPGRVTLFRSSERDYGEGFEWDENLGWEKLAGGGLEIHDVPGNHLSIFEEPLIQVLAEKFRTCLKDVGVADSTN
jgi:thioesterase domain-containing protein